MEFESIEVILYYEIALNEYFPGSVQIKLN